MSVLIAALAKTVTAATSSGVLTIDDTTNVWPGQNGWLSKAGQTSLQIAVVEVLSATTFRAKAIAGTQDGNFAKVRPNAVGSDSPVAYPGNQSSDLSAFNGGGTTFNAESQVVASNPFNGGKFPVA